MCLGSPRHMVDVRWTVVAAQSAAVLTGLWLLIQELFPQSNVLLINI